MAKASGIFKYGYGVLNDLGMFSPTEKAIDLLGQDKFPARDLLRLEDDGKTKGLLSKFGKGVSKEYINSGTSLYTPIVATGLAGATANKLMGNEEDIITEDNGI